MPELPEVQTVVDTLRLRLLGRRIQRVNLLRADIVQPAGFNLAAQLQGRSVMDLTRRGKRIVFTLDDGNRFFIHLGMTGRLTLEGETAEVMKHTHLILEMGKERHEGTQARRHEEKGKRGNPPPSPSVPPCLRASVPSSLRFRDPRRFGGVFWLGSEPPAGTMGPEPLLMKPAQFASRLAKTKRAIKNVLLDQTVLAGVGNIYADESLFVAGIHPLTLAHQLNYGQVKTLTRAVKSTLRRALRHRGSTLRDYVDADGKAGAFQKLHNVYNRAGQPCRVCRTPIERIVLAAAQRTSARSARKLAQ